MSTLCVGNDLIKPSNEVKNLGVWLDPSLTMNTHINKTCIVFVEYENIYRFTKPQIISEHFKRGNSDYIPRVRQQYEINLKPRHMRDELSHRFLLVLY